MPRYAMIAGMGESALSCYNTQTKDIVKIELPYEEDNAGFRSVAIDGADIYLAGSYSSKIYKYNYITKRFYTITKCIGKYPVKIKLWKGYIIIACNDTDTVETCLKRGGQSMVSHRLGNFLTSIEISNDICFAISAADQSLYLLQLPFLVLLQRIQLPFTPLGITLCEDRILCYGSKAEHKNGCLCIISHTGELLQNAETACIPMSGCIAGDEIVLSCAGEDLLCVHDYKSLKLKRVIKTFAMPDQLCALSESSVILGMQLRDQVVEINTKKGSVIRTLPSVKEPSEMAIMHVR